LDIIGSTRQLNAQSMHRLLLSFLLFLLVHPFQAQGVTIGNPNPPHPSAVLDIQSVQGGVLFPRMTTAQRNAINAAPNGLVIYNTDTDCLQIYYTGQGWQNISCRCQAFPNANFTGPAGGIASIAQSVTFLAPSGVGYSYAWSFAQGTPATSSLQQPSVSWSQPGNYVVSLTVTDANGCTSTQSDTLTVTTCPPAGTQTFAFTGTVQTFTVPACKQQVTIQVWGAQGDNATIGGTGGLGGYATGTLAVTPGQVLQVYVGGRNGYNGGGTPGPNGSQVSSGPIGLDSGGVGGGASDVRTTAALNTRVIVAGGGGGGGHAGVWTGCQPGGTGGAGGVGGGAAGGNGASSACSCANGGGFGGQPGTQVAGGAGGTLNPTGCSTSSTVMHGNPGSFGLGGNGSTQFGSSSGPGGGGGGGGGWYGGGAGSNGNNTTAGGGGGGGSNYIGGVTNGQSQNGVRSGQGQVIISWN
jgi:hypothetical protein